MVIFVVVVIAAIVVIGVVAIVILMALVAPLLAMLLGELLLPLLVLVDALFVLVTVLVNVVVHMISLTVTISVHPLAVFLCVLMSVVSIMTSVVSFASLHALAAALAAFCVSICIGPTSVGPIDDFASVRVGCLRSVDRFLVALLRAFPTRVALVARYGCGFIAFGFVTATGSFDGSITLLLVAGLTVGGLCALGGLRRSTSEHAIPPASPIAPIRRIAGLDVRIARLDVLRGGKAGD